MKHFVISGIGFEDKKSERKRCEFELEVDTVETEEEEVDEIENVIPMLCYGLIMMVLITLMVAVIFIPCYKLLTGSELNSNLLLCVKQILSSVLVGEIFGVLFSIFCVLIQSWAMKLDGENEKLKDV